jgi:hypothetical protein
MITLAAFVVAVLTSVVLRRQQQRHRFEEQMEYERLGWEMPPMKPRLSTTEVTLNFIIGLFFLALGLISLHAFFVTRAIYDAPDMHYGIALFLGIGIALIMAAAQGLAQNRAARRSGRMA